MALSAHHTGPIDDLYRLKKGQTELSKTAARARRENMDSELYLLGRNAR